MSSGEYKYYRIVCPVHNYWCDCGSCNNDTYIACVIKTDLVPGSEEFIEKVFNGKMESFSPGSPEYKKHLKEAKKLVVE